MPPDRIYKRRTTIVISHPVLLDDVALTAARDCIDFVACWRIIGYKSYIIPRLAGCLVSMGFLGDFITSIISPWLGFATVRDQDLWKIPRNGNGASIDCVVVTRLHLPSVQDRRRNPRTDDYGSLSQ